MATTNPTTDHATSRRDTSDDDQGIVQAARQVADTVAGAAGDVSARIPDVAQTTRDAFTEANRIVQGGSDQTLKLVSAASIGFAIGLLVGGASRLLVIASLVPAALVGATLLERNDVGFSRTASVTKRV